MPQLTGQEQLFLGVTGSLAAGGLIWWAQRRLRYANFPSSEFFQPEVVQEIASEFPNSSEDAFILAAWDFVGREITYEPIWSNLTFIGTRVKCLKCYLPAQVLERGMGNCVGASALLASLLATRIPGDRVALVVGNLTLNGVGGHAWVEVQRSSGQWVVLEATRRPGVNPWLSVEAASRYYQPMAIITPLELECYSPSLCVSFAGCQCLGALDKLYE